MHSLRLALRSLWFVTTLLGVTLGACIDTPPDPGPVVARLVTEWDPLACGEPHRVVVELEDEGGTTLSASTPCNLGGLTLDVSHLGSYRGRIYAWALAAPIRSITPIELTIAAPIVHWPVSTPR
ncbi:MAG TPA: hypothetical protein VHN14_07530 [Kofleriaceae bacterium]|jgi:hypothetical protein|nr:hypothetical protein [Kofleriaceae bacterium]